MKHLYKKIHALILPKVKIDEKVNKMPGILDQFFRLGSKHNRINRVGFIGNSLSILLFILVIYLYISSQQYFILSLGKSGLIVVGTILILLNFFTTWLQAIQIIKRCHDFGSNGKYTTLLFLMLVIFGTFGMYFEQGILVSGEIIIYLGLLLYLTLKSGEKNENNMVGQLDFKNSPFRVSFLYF